MYAEEIFINNCDAIIVIDPYENKIITSNPECSNLLGYENESLLSLTPSHLFSENYVSLIIFTQEVLHKGSGWSHDIPVINSTGETINLDITANYLINNSDHTTEVICLSMRDRNKIAHRYELTEANSVHRGGLKNWKTIENVFQEIERENQLILGAAGEGIYGVNAKGETTFVNPAAERMLGWTADELSGSDIHAKVHHSHEDGSHYANKACPIFAAFRDGEIHHVDNEVFWRKDGSSFPVEYTSTPITENNQVVGAVVVFRDISERRLAEFNLRQALSQVEALKARLEMENAYLQEEIREENSYNKIVGESAAINNIINKIELVAKTDANVLITGESGTGKELIAYAIHDNSLRRDRPLIRVNCASIPKDLFESEFFGHVKGAFTGAIKDRAGRFELADGGTLFLDEVGEIPPEQQSKLLRVLQEQQFERVGDSKTRHVDVRIITATNRNLENEVKQNNFREDLYFRLNVFPIISPALRDRPEDIPLLASHFLSLGCQRFNKPELNITSADMKMLQNHPWPGNIRELINVVERGIISSQNKHIRIDLPNTQLSSSASNTTNKKEQSDSYLLTDTERHVRDRDNIIKALIASEGKIFGAGGAAELLHVKPTTLASRIKRLRINKWDYINH